MKKQAVATDSAPAALGPYSQAIKACNLIFASGQVPIDPASGELVTGDIQKQTRQCLKNLDAVLKAAGSSLENVVKTTVFLADMDQFTAMNAAYAEFFLNAPPARACVQVARLPRDAEVEIECVALTG